MLGSRPATPSTLSVTTTISTVKSLTSEQDCSDLPPVEVRDSCMGNKEATLNEYLFPPITYSNPFDILEICSIKDTTLPSSPTNLLISNDAPSRTVHLDDPLDPNMPSREILPPFVEKVPSSSPYKGGDQDSSVATIISFLDQPVSPFAANSLSVVLPLLDPVSTSSPPPLQLIQLPPQTHPERILYVQKAPHQKEI